MPNSAASSLRGLEASWNANAHHHYHLGVGRLARSTLADANRRRPLAIFGETFAMLSRLADRLVRWEGREMVRLIDSTPIPLGRLVDWAKSNGRVTGLKLHVVHDSIADNPTDTALTEANVNDIESGRRWWESPAVPTSSTRPIAAMTGGRPCTKPVPASSLAARRTAASAAAARRESPASTATTIRRRRSKE